MIFSITNSIKHIEKSKKDFMLNKNFYIHTILKIIR